MTDAAVAAVALPFEGATALRQANAHLLKALDRRLGQDSRPESEAAALRELEAQIRDFLARGAATGALLEETNERTACQVILDYWSSTLSLTGVAVSRPRLLPFDAASLPDLKDRPCPYVGLEAFSEGTFFFGRKKAVDSLLERVTEVQLVVVQGPSGSGKSSLVIGGALPVLAAAGHEPRYTVVGPFTPGNAPLQNLISALERALPGILGDVEVDVIALRNNPARLAQVLIDSNNPAVLLIVDQFEEIFTLCDGADRAFLLTTLHTLLHARPGDRAILTVRDEFSSELDKLDLLRPYLARHARFSMNEWSMGYDELRAAVEGPAALVNLQFAPGIVDKMVKSVLGRDTALPLLQFALHLLWRERDRNRVTKEVYARIGNSPLAALERFADGFYDGLANENKDEVKYILLELVRIDRMLEPYRLPLLRSELLEKGSPRTAAVLSTLEDNNFVRVAPTADNTDAVVEVKHEALLRNWPRYVGWINGKRERVRQRIALTEAAQHWADTGRSKTQGLLDPWHLKEVESLSDLSPLEAEYVRVSAEAADRERIAREEALRRRERRKWAIAGTCALLVVAAMFVLRESYQRGQRETLRQTIDVQARMALAREASTRGQTGRAFTGSLVALSGLRALGADSLTGSLRTQARKMLVSTLSNSADVQQLFVAGDGVFQSVAFHPTRSEALLAYAGVDSRTYLSGSNAAREQSPIDSCPDNTLTKAVAFDPRGRFLAAGCSDGTLSVWSTDTWNRLGGKNKVMLSKRIWTIAVSPDGRLVAAGGQPNRVALVTLDPDGAPTRQPAVLAGGEEPVGGIWSLAFSPSGDTLLAGDGVGAVFTCSASESGSWECAKSAAYPGNPESQEDKDAIRALAYAPDNAHVAVGHHRGGVEIWDSTVPAKSGAPVEVGESDLPVNSLSYFEACGRPQLAIAKGPELLYRPRPSDQASQELEPPGDCAVPSSASVGDEVYGIAFHARSGRLAAATRAGTVAVLEPMGGRDPVRLVVPPVRTRQHGPLRGVVVAGEGTTSWLVVPVSQTRPNEESLAARRIRNGKIDADDAWVMLPRKVGQIDRVSTSLQQPYLATLGSSLPRVRVWTFENGFTDFREKLSLGPEDLKELEPKRIALSPDLGPEDLEELEWKRIALSPDGKWLLVSFSPKEKQLDPKEKQLDPKEKQLDPKKKQLDPKKKQLARLLAVPLSDKRKAHWIGTDLTEVKEIAFGHDSFTLGVGGKPSENPSGAGVDVVQTGKVTSVKLESSPQSLLPLSQEAMHVWELALAVDSRGQGVVLAGGKSGVIDRWDIDSGDRLDPLHAGTWPIAFIAFSPEESLVAAADRHNGVWVWDTSDWLPLQLTLPDHRVLTPGFLGFGGRGSWLASGAGPREGKLGDSSLQLWDLDVESLQGKICAVLHKPGRTAAERQPKLTPWEEICETQ